jgi:N6-adenosine-specific RNA methylase IME4
MALVKDITKVNTKYQVILADPPWSFRGQVQRGGKDQDYSSSAAEYYVTLPIEDLCKMGKDIKRISDPEGCLLYLWYSPPILEDAMRLTEAWGFKHATTAFVWVKTKDGVNLQVNPGHYTMSSCEMVNVAKIKKVPTPRGARNIRQVVFAPRTNHSAKPLEVRERITQMHPLQKKLELFSRFDQTTATDMLWDDYGMDIGSVPWLP